MDGSKGMIPPLDVLGGFAVHVYGSWVGCIIAKAHYMSLYTIIRRSMAVRPTSAME